MEGSNNGDTLTYHHQCKLESLFDRLAMNLIGQVGKSDVAWSLGVGELPLL